jgi:hypothetical protein
MSRTLVCCLALLVGLTVPAQIGAAPFTIDLEAKQSKASQTAHAQPILGGGRPKTRAVLDIKVGATVTVKWTLRNTDAKATFKNVLVHCFVVKEKEIGQLAVPKLNKDVVVETAQTVDFKPKDVARGALTFIIEKPGNYLVRLETIGAAATREDNDYFAALDLRVR